MKSSTRPAPFVPARLGQALRILQALLGRWEPKPSPVLVPIPIRAEQPMRDVVERRWHRDS